MKKETVKERMNRQKRRIARQVQKEQENGTTEAAKARFYKKPYYMRWDRCGNNLGGRE